METSLIPPSYNLLTEGFEEMFKDLSINVAYTTKQQQNWASWKVQIYELDFNGRNVRANAEVLSMVNFWPIGVKNQVALFMFHTKHVMDRKSLNAYEILKKFKDDE